MDHTLIVSVSEKSFGNSAANRVEVMAHKSKAYHLTEWLDFVEAVRAFADDSEDVAAVHTHVGADPSKVIIKFLDGSRITLIEGK